MPAQGEWGRTFPPADDAPMRARRWLRQVLVEAGLDARDTVSETAVLLASELFDNAVLHAGTDFDVDVEASDHSLTVMVTDRGASPLELRLISPPSRYGRGATHGRGLPILERLSSSWGTRHEEGTLHRVWFTLRRGPDRPPDPDPGPDPPGAAGAPAARPEGERDVFADATFTESDRVRALLRMPDAEGDSLDTIATVTELTRRLYELLGLDGVALWADRADGGGRQLLGGQGPDPSRAAPDRIMRLPLPVTSPLRGELVIAVGTHRPPTAMAELAAHRIAIALESEWLTRADRRRRAWISYLAESADLLGQSLDLELTTALIPQLVVPRLGQWCAVYLGDRTTRPRLAAFTHSSEDALPELQTALEPSSRFELAEVLTALLHAPPASTHPTWFQTPSDGIAVALTAAGRTIGVLAVGRPLERPRNGDDVALVTDLARRAAIAIDNAQRATHHRDISRALQQALLPRALPTAAGVEFAATYLPLDNDVGGDFYDVVVTGPDSWVAVIGDVCGKGPQAAARTSLVRDVLRVLVKEGRPVPEALTALNHIMLEAGDPYQFCSVAAASISRRSDLSDLSDGAALSVELVLAGHPQPILVHSDGATEPVGVHGPALGLLKHTAYTATHCLLHPGDTLLSYTDGVIEHRSGREQFGADRLLASLTGGPAARSAEDVLARVRQALTEFSDDDRTDDIALLATRASRTASP